ncbi:MAG: hypothetical protein JRJ39_03830 [Deltaproteobacteria bacterium]|nr:hypothetical protein [Deltaproteobacteria bacterium]MBW1847331.1 hypothetical protein [Deltaproteobacteria bacterium]MBW2179632.1 hypothetical protein [Deltaproteobacteria bacterium]
MNIRLKVILAVLMPLALSFGFLHIFVPENWGMNFERLHIFLFNLCSGGTVIICFTEEKSDLTIKSALFLLLSISYAILAFLKLYVPAIVISFILAVIVEQIRIKHFSFFPKDFFKENVPASEKFHHAALLCLSIGLVISAMVIINNEYLKIFNMEKLKLDTFFLGFSFPVSLITMSVIFALIKNNKGKLIINLKNFGFWSVNLGVIIFFGFIIFEKLLFQVYITVILFASVLMIFYLFYQYSEKVDQKLFLTSGMGFLLIAAVTGIMYIVFQIFPDYRSEDYSWLLRLHSFVSLYGWNFCGLVVISRYGDFPLSLHSGKIILLHWITVVILAPLGNYYQAPAIAAVVLYTFLLWMILFRKGVSNSEANVPSFHQ